MAITDFESKVVPSRFYDDTDIGGGTGWGWPVLEVRARVDRNPIKLQVPMYDTRDETVKVSIEAARKYLQQGQ